MQVDNSYLEREKRHFLCVKTPQFSSRNFSSNMIIVCFHFVENIINIPEDKLIFHFRICCQITAQGFYVMSVLIPL